MSNKTLRMAILLMITVLNALFAFSTSVYADGEVSTLEELQTALNNGSLEEVIVNNAITLPNGTILDGKGKTVRVEKPYVKEDGKLEESPTAGNIFNIESSSEVVIKNMTIMGGEKSSSGAVSSNGYLTMENVNIVRSNRGLDDYGGVATLKNCNLYTNVCKSAGAIWCGDGAKLILDGCSITGNRSNGGSNYGGGAIGLNGGYLYANNTVFAFNSTHEIGGAINLYDGIAYLMNCTLTGNCSSGNSEYYGGGIGNHGGTLYAVNSVFIDNYAKIINASISRSDISIYSGSNASLYNCLYSKARGDGTFSTTNCVIDESTTVATSYENSGILLQDGTVSKLFTHPVLTTGTNPFSKYVIISADGSAARGGIDTYFDYSDTSSIKMGYGDSSSITSLGNLTAPISDKKITTYYEGGTRDSGVIGASGADGVILPEIKTWAELQTALAAGGTVTLTQDIVAGSGDSELYIPNGVTSTLDLNGYIINKNDFGGNVIRVYGGNLTIDDSNPNRIHTPEVSYNEPISGDSVIISGGIITGGNRGICLEHAGTITMNAGTIAGNYLNDKYSNGGAGAYVLSGSTFTMNGGSIENNTAPYGNAGGVYVYYGSIFNMVGGTVRNNVCAGEGGGFFLYDNQSSRAKLYLMGGTVTGNKSAGNGGAVNINTNGGELFVSGNPVVQGNYKDSEVSNIKGPGDRFVNIVGEITDGAYIGVSTASVPTLEQNAVITSNFNTYNAGKNPENYFFCDYGEEILTGLNDAGEATFIYPVTSWAELRTSFGHYGAIKLTSDIKASASDTRIELGWCETCLDLNGHVIDCSAMTANTNAFATTSRYSVLTIIDSNPTAIHSPALSYIDPITEEVVVINGGIITGRPDGVFTGTEISCQSGAVVMKGGTILGKSTPGGSAVYLTYESANFYMDGGTICGNNSSTDGGGIFNLQGTIHLNGGKITGNIANGNGGGIYQYENSKITISGKPVVNGNINGEEESSNIYLTNKAITISDELKEGASLGITTQTVPTYSSLVKFTTDFNTYNGGDNPANYFVSDLEDKVVVLTNDNEATLSQLYSITITSNEYGTATVDKSEINYEEHPILTAVPNDAEHYRFKEWQVLSGKVNIINNTIYLQDADDPDNPVTDIQIKAIFEKMPYTVQFETYGGGTIDNQIVLFDEKAVQPTANPSREGYSFTGWYSDAQMSTVFDFNSKITKDTIIYAGYSKDTWTDITTDDSIATVNGIVILKKQDDSINRIIPVYEGKIGVPYKIPMTDDVITMINEAQTIANNYVTDNGYINDGFENETKEIKDWDSRKYETLDSVYSDEHKAMIREHVASGSYGKSTTFTTIAVVTKVFPDVKVGEWYSEGIRYCKVNGLMNGYTNGENKGKFGLNDSIKRGQIAAILYRLAGSPYGDTDPNTDLVSKFLDVQNKGSYYYKAVIWASENGVVTGYTSGANAGKFGSNDSIKRQDLAVMLGRYAKYVEGKDTTSTYSLDNFRDGNEVSNYAKENTYIQYIVEKGIITGKDRMDGEIPYVILDPKATARRSDAATMIMRFCQNILGMP